MVKDDSDLYQVEVEITGRPTSDSFIHLHFIRGYLPYFETESGERMRNVVRKFLCNLKQNTKRNYATAGVTLKSRDFISLKDFRPVEIEKLLWTALDLKTRHKSQDASFSTILNGKCLSVISDVPFLRTKTSVSHGMSLLGGCVSMLSPADLGKDNINNEIGRSLSSISDIIAVRSCTPDLVERLAEESSAPVINMSSDLYHPIKALSYLVTWLEEFEYLRRLRVAWVGHNCNLVNSLMFACGLAGIKLQIGTPVGYEPEPSILMKAYKCVSSTTSELHIENDVTKAAYRADILIGGAWSHVPEKIDNEIIIEDFEDFMITRKIFEDRSAVGKFMHQLPWSELEVTRDVMFDEDNLTWTELENRKFAAMAVLINLLTDYKPLMAAPSFEKVPVN